MEFINSNSYNNNLFIENINYEKYPNIQLKNNFPRNVSIIYDKNNNKLGYKFFRCFLILSKKTKIRKSFINPYESISEKWDKCLEFVNKNHKEYIYKK
jgi:hypothetical protein